MSVTISGSGQIIKQVIQTVVTTGVSFSGYSPGSWVNITGASVSITPTNSSNKIFVSVSTTGSVANNGNYELLMQITRNGTVIGNGTRASAVSCGTANVIANANYAGPMIWQYMDSPATTSAVTYQIQGGTEQGIGGYFGGSYGNSAAYSTASPIVITAMEVAYA